MTAAEMAVTGAALISQPGTNAFPAAGLLAMVSALASACFIGIEAILIKWQSDTEPALQFILIGNSIGAARALDACALL